MTNGKLIAGIAAGTVIALLAIPATRKLITDAVSGIADSLKDMAGDKLQDAGKKIASS